MNLSLFEKVQWWHLLIITGATLLVPVFRAVAVILLAKCVKAEIAKLAIPLILPSKRASIFPLRKLTEQNGDEKKTLKQESLM